MIGSHEENRLDTFEFLDNTFVKEVSCFKEVVLCITNKTKALENTRDTIVGLDPKEGIKYFWGNFLDHTKYEKLVPIPYMAYVKTPRIDNMLLIGLMMTLLKRRRKPITI